MGMTARYTYYGNMDALKKQFHPIKDELAELFNPNVTPECDLTTMAEFTKNIDNRLHLISYDSQQYTVLEMRCGDIGRVNIMYGYL